MAVDPVHDMGAVQLTRITRVMELPGFVKSAAMPAPDDVADLPDTSFADPITKTYPVHTKAACWLSYAYFKLQEDSHEKRAAKRMESCFRRHGRFWEISEDLDKVAEAVDALKAVPTEKVASDELYALVVGGGSKAYRLFPVTTPRDIVKSAEDLVEARGKLTYAMRKEAAENLVKAAHAQGVSESALPTAVHCMAGLGVTVKEAAQHEVARRKNAAKTTAEKKAAGVLTKLATALDTHDDVLSQDISEKVASALDLYDRFTGLHKHYGAEFQFPEDVLFGFTKDAANKMSESVVSLITGSTYWLRDLEKGASAIRALGDDIMDSISNIDGSLDMYKAADVLPTLPRDMASELDRALEACGVPRATMDKSAAVLQALEIPAPEKSRTVRKTAEVDSKTKRAAAFKLARAKDVVARLRAEATKEQKPEKPGQPRKGDGKFINKAPNTNKTVLVKEDK